MSTAGLIRPPVRVDPDAKAAAVIAEFDARRRSGRYDRLPAHHQPFEEPYVVRHNVGDIEFDVLIANENAMHWYEDLHRLVATAVYGGEFDIVRQLDLARPGDVVLDCGAHHGVLAGMLAKIVGPAGHVYAFEPSLIGSDLVELNARLNGLTHLTAVRAAVGERHGKLRYSERDARIGIDHFDVTEVPQVTLDDYAHTRPALVKLDVEGAEAAALAGAHRVLESTPNILLEVHPESILASHGTTVEAVMAHVDWSRYDCFQAEPGTEGFKRVARPWFSSAGGWAAARRPEGPGAVMARVRRLAGRRGRSAPPPAPEPRPVVAEADGLSYDLTAIADDPLAQTVREGHTPGGPVHDAVLHAARAGTRILDLGARLGSTALHAAKAGAEVIAVEPDPGYAASLEASARLNGLALRVVKAMPAAGSGSLAYSPAGPWGHVRKVTEIDDVTAPIEVQGLSMDGLVADAGWDRVDVVRLTLSGYEPFALEGLAPRLHGASAPSLLVLEASAHALSWYGHTASDLRGQLLALGYGSFIVDTDDPRRVIPAGPGDIQPRCVSALLAVREEGRLRELGYRVEPYSREELVQRLLTACASEGATDRWHAATELEQGPEWLRDDPRVRAAMERLQLDPTGIVRDASWWANQAHVGADAADLAGDEEMATEMEVPGAGRITLLVPPGPSDTVVRELLESDDYPPFAPNQLLLALLRPGMVFADLGAHVGTYSLPAAALGARVVAVDAHPQHARLLERAAERNGFSDRLTVVHAAIGAEPGEVEFLCSFGWSMVIPTQGAPPEFAHARRVRVPVLRVPDALAEAGLTHADLIKMDLEGSEAEAVAGMSELLSGDDAPAVLFEINPLRLGPMGSSTSDLLSLFERFGYRLFKLEQSMEEPRLVPITPEIFLPDSSDDVLAVKGEPELDRWRVTHPLSRHDQVDRALGVVRSPFRASRRVVAERLRTAPPWLLRDPLMREGLRALRHDVRPEVREAAAWSAELM